MNPDADPYSPNPGGILVPPTPPSHRDEEYDPATFDILRDMQARHFWYAGRHRFLLHALRAATLPRAASADPLPRAIDLGGGCGGWVSYLKEHHPDAFAELALSDSSVRALEMAGPIVGPDVPRYQIDLLDLAWAARERWDVAFLLDVLEHIPDDLAVLRQVWRSLRPGGLLFVTTPAIQRFWTYNDEMVNHVRRYSRRDFHRLASAAGFDVRSTRYFMFFLSPLLLLARLRRHDVPSMSQQEIADHLKRTHRVPSAPLNRLLGLTFAAETPLGHAIPFPWGTSILGVFQKPR